MKVRIESDGHFRGSSSIKDMVSGEDLSDVVTDMVVYFDENGDLYADLTVIPEEVEVEATIGVVKRAVLDAAKPAEPKLSDRFLDSPEVHLVMIGLWATLGFISYGIGEWIVAFLSTLFTVSNLRDYLKDKRKREAKNAGA